MSNGKEKSANPEIDRMISEIHRLKYENETLELFLMAYQELCEKSHCMNNTLLKRLISYRQAFSEYILKEAT